MPDAQLLAGGPKGVLVARAVVGHDALDAHTQAGVVVNGLVKELHAADGLLVAEYPSKGDSGVIVDGQVHGVPAYALVPVESAVTGDAVRRPTDDTLALAQAEADGVRNMYVPRFRRGDAAGPATGEHPAAGTGP